MGAPNEDEFFRFLVAEGIVDSDAATIPSGPGREDGIRALLAHVAPDVLAAARERFEQHGMRTAATIAADPLLGREIGGCRIEKLLGAGGMGAVYQATQISIDRPVAFKVQKGAPHPDLVERFRSEARLLGRLHSPHIVDVYDVGATEGLQYFVMEFMPGGSLSSYVKKQPQQMLSRADARRMLVECCLGLAEASEHGVLHRDIKPDNLLLDGKSTVKIADFGIAKLLDAEYGLTQTGFSPGTPAFKSPEQVAASELDFRTDMYSLGVSFWMLLTGVRPRDSLTRQEQLDQMREVPPFSAPEITVADGDPLLLTICRMMALKRADRFASWKDLIDALRALPDGDGRSAMRDVPTTLPATTGTGRRAWLAGTAVVATVAIVWSVWPGRSAVHDDSSRVQENRSAARSEHDTTRGDSHPAKPPASIPPETDPRQQPAAGDPQHAKTEPPPRTPEAPRPDPDAARRQFLAGLATAVPSSPRTANEVDAQLGQLRAKATEFGVVAEPAWTGFERALQGERAAAEARDTVRAVKALTTFEQHAQLEAAVKAIELPAYRADCEAWVRSLFAERPNFLRVDAGDVAALQRWATWELTAANVSSDKERPLPLLVQDRRRGCRMALVTAPGVAPTYLDVAEVSVAQWEAKGGPVQALQWPEAMLPIRDVAAADVDAFLAAAGARLPTVAEFRAAIGTRPGDRYWWGNTAPPKGFVLNVADRARHRETPTAPYLSDLDDTVATVAAVDDSRFAQGANGAFFHLLGNVAESCVEDGKRVVIGGSFLSSTWDALLADQRMPVLNTKRQDIGFRAARDIGR
ncbi:MAG: protein kinase [Planctomycetes bacterium]|nr:protein kinase [Planctomycetota bacterium]